MFIRILEVLAVLAGYSRVIDVFTCFYWISEKHAKSIRPLTS